MLKYLYYFINKFSGIEQNLRYLIYRKKYNIDKSFRFNGKDIYIYGNGILNVSKDSYIGSLSTIQLSERNKVTIGEGCMISHNVRMYTSSAVPDYDFKYKVPMKYGDIIIGNYVWIGANVFINPGINIGDNSVIGANSVITKDVEPHSIYGGVPAKLIRMKKYCDVQQSNVSEKE